MVTKPGAALALPRAAVMITSGTDHACALVTDGDVYCWGSGWSLGNGKNDYSPTPVKVTGKGMGRAVVR